MSLVFKVFEYNKMSLFYPMRSINIELSKYEPLPAIDDLNKRKKKSNKKLIKNKLQT